MKKVVFAFLLLGVYYVAGMYGSPALMVLFLTQLLLMSRYPSRQKLSLHQKLRSSRSLLVMG